MGFFKDLLSDDDEEDEGRAPFKDPVQEANALVDEERYEEAVVECEKALMADPHAAAAMALKGFALAKLAAKAGDTEAMGEAMGWVDRAVACNPKDPIVMEMHAMMDAILKQVEGR